MKSKVSHIPVAVESMRIRTNPVLNREGIECISNEYDFIAGRTKRDFPVFICIFFLFSVARSGTFGNRVSLNSVFGKGWGGREGVVGMRMQTCKLKYYSRKNLNKTEPPISVLLCFLCSQGQLLQILFLVSGLS